MIDYTKIAEMAKHTRVIVKPDANVLILINFQNGLIKGSEDAARRIREFIHGRISDISDVYVYLQANPFLSILHSSFWVDEKGYSIEPGTFITIQAMDSGSVRISPFVNEAIPSLREDALKILVRHIVEQSKGIIVRPYSSILGGASSVMISSIEECVFYHACLSGRNPAVIYTGISPFAEFKSVFSPVVKEGPNGAPLNPSMYYMADVFRRYRNVIFAGSSFQCVCDSVRDIVGCDGSLKDKVKIFSDCCGPDRKDNVDQISNKVSYSVVTSNEWKRNN